MKRSQQSVRSVETGATKGDFYRSQSIRWKNKGGRNATTEEGRRGSGMAPRPRAAKQELIASSTPGAPSQASLARVKNARSSASGTAGSAGSFNPVQNNANANLKGKSMAYGGNGTPPAQRGGPAGLRAGGRNQTWPNGPLYSAGKPGKHDRGPGALSTAKPKRRGKGAAFYGEYPS
ncbi:MAG: hypothetical protein JO356_08745 [Acidobacteria bacterium]|nr:hypothetical protein [Acidobacteriota bacterium]